MLSQCGELYVMFTNMKLTSLVFPPGNTILVKRLKSEGIHLDVKEVFQWKQAVSDLFPSVEQAIEQICEQARTENQITTLTGTQIQLDLETNQNATIWNTLTQSCTNELVCCCKDSKTHAIFFRLTNVYA